MEIKEGVYNEGQQLLIVERLYMCSLVIFVG